ncbi:hypothetical protein ACIQF6_05405 [Kitasatospora sp. NPDC092948]|uniref:hypothetical protein n=1 Tax=Kitasatospora sp. NPDC092948 TaxID=3364088 RepID=UPI00380D9CC9
MTKRRPSVRRDVFHTLRLVPPAVLLLLSSVPYASVAMAFGLGADREAGRGAGGATVSTMFSVIGR